VFSKDVNLTEIINTGITTLAELLTALKSGETNQNGLWGIININNITSHLHDDDNANNRTSNFLSTIKGHTPHAVCPGVAVLFARGTKEPGNMGFLAGPPFVTALQHYANGSSLAVQGVDYPATARGFKAGGSPEGAETMAALANATREACPGAKVVLAGYSQGAQVVRRACGFLGDDAAGRLSSVVLFGDPGNGTAVPGVAADRIFTACHDGDAVCKGGSVVRPQHLNYSGDAPPAALFVMAKTGLGMGSGDAVLDGMGDIPMMNSTAQQGIGEMVVGDLGSDKGDSQGVLGLG
jgi:cutinase